MLLFVGWEGPSRVLMSESHIEQLVGCVISELKRVRSPRDECEPLGLHFLLDVSEADGSLAEGALYSVHLLVCEVAQCVSAIFVLCDVQYLFHNHLIYV